MLVSIVACFLYGRSKKLLFVPTASATAGAHRDRVFVASFAQQPEIQYLVFRGQIVSGDTLNMKGPSSSIESSSGGEEGCSGQ